MFVSNACFAVWVICVPYIFKSNTLSDVLANIFCFIVSSLLMLSLLHRFFDLMSVVYLAFVAYTSGICYHNHCKTSVRELCPYALFQEFKEFPGHTFKSLIHFKLIFMINEYGSGLQTSFCMYRYPVLHLFLEETVFFQ